MPGATLTTLDKVLKEFYLPPVTDQLNNETLMLQRLDKSDKEIFGKTAYAPLHKSRSGGVGARPESGTLPAAGNQAYERAAYDLKYLYGRIRVTGPSMAKTRSEAGAFLQALRSELDGIRDDLKLDLARQFYGAGDGKIVTCGVTGASTSVVIASSEPIDKGFIYPGMVIDIGTVAAPTFRVSGATVVSASGTTVVIDSAITTAATDFIFRSGSVGPSVVYETDGLQNMLQTSAGTFGGLNAATAGNEWWDNLRTNLAGALSLDSMHQSVNKVRRAGGNTSILVTSLGIQRAYFNLLQSLVRYTEPTKIRGGFETLDYFGKPVVGDYLHPWGKMNFLDERFIKVYTNRDWHFLDEDGTVLKWVSGVDAWEAVLARYLNMGTTRRNVQMLLYGITDATGI